jgi:steroid delta-isomerase-like uncharacterized protein
VKEESTIAELTMRFTDMTAADLQAHLDQRSVNTHNAASVASWFSEDGVQRQVATGVVARGRDAIRDGEQALFIGFPDVHLQVRDLFATADRMCVQCVITGTHDGEFLGIPPTGRRVECELCLVLRFGADGLVDEEVIYQDSAAMLRQLGVLPEA